MTVQQTVAAWPWGGMIATALGSGVISAWLTHFLQARTSAQDRTRIARDTALKAAGRFEECARLMSGAAGDWLDFHMGNAHTTTRKGLAPVPVLEDLDWKPVEPSLAAKAFGFVGERSLSQALVEGYFSDDDYSGADEMVEQAFRLGLLAWSIGQDLRTAYDLPAAPTLTVGYDFIGWMTEQVEERRADKLAVKEQHRAAAALRSETSDDHEV